MLAKAAGGMAQKQTERTEGQGGVAATALPPHSMTRWRDLGSAKKRSGWRRLAAMCRGTGKTAKVDDREWRMAEGNVWFGTDGQPAEAKGR